jgi:hydroxymethylbilane synthase
VSTFNAAAICGRVRPGARRVRGARVVAPHPAGSIGEEILPVRRAECGPAAKTTPRAQRGDGARYASVSAVTYHEFRPPWPTQMWAWHRKRERPSRSRGPVAHRTYNGIFAICRLELPRRCSTCMTSSPCLRIGTRASALARWQAEWVAARLNEQGVEVELVPISTRGDREQQGPIGHIAGGDGVFTKELERALLADEIDLAVHSLKDLPTAMPPDLVLAAVPRRGPTGDVLIARRALSFDALPKGAVVGTGSLRRRAQLWHGRPDLRMADIRGNVDTRLRKVDNGEFDAIVLAEAGLERLGLAGFITEVLPKTLILPAVGQGALGIETRANDRRTREAVRALEDFETRQAVEAERSMLAKLCGGCLAPIGAWGRSEDGHLRLSGVVVGGDGRTRLLATETAPPEAAAELGQRVAQALLAQGAAALIEACRQGPAPQPESSAG